MSSPADVALARKTEPADSAIRRVVVGVDDTDAGLAALREAVELSGAHDVPLVAVRAWALGLPRHGGRRLRRLAHKHVVLYFSGEEQRAAATALTRKALRGAVGRLPAGLQLEIRTPASDPAVALTAIAGEPGDVLVVGHKRAISPRGIVHGSVTAHCLRHARCPVIVVTACLPPDRADGPGFPGLLAWSERRQSAHADRYG
jgi:nucleotide-binding universal stress UspA family protein